MQQRYIGCRSGVTEDLITMLLEAGVTVMYRKCWRHEFDSGDHTLDDKNWTVLRDIYELEFEGDIRYERSRVLGHIFERKYVAYAEVAWRIDDALLPLLQARERQAKREAGERYKKMLADPEHWARRERFIAGGDPRWYDRQTAPAGQII